MTKAVEGHRLPVAVGSLRLNLFQQPDLGCSYFRPIGMNYECNQ